MKCLFLAFSLFFSSFAAAYDLGTPIQHASNEYLKNGLEAFIPALLKGSPMEGEKSAYTQSSALRQIEAYYGNYLGIEPMFEKELSSKTRLVYYVMNYENSPVFGFALLYKKKEGEIVTNFNFNTKLWEIMPSEAIFK